MIWHYTNRENILRTWKCKLILYNYPQSLDSHNWTMLYLLWICKKILLIFCYIYPYPSVCLSACGSVLAPAHMWRAEDNLWDLVLSSYQVDYGDQAQVARPSSKHFYPLNYFSSPNILVYFYVLSKCIFKK